MAPRLSSNCTQKSITSARTCVFWVQHLQLGCLEKNISPSTKTWKIRTTKTSNENEKAFQFARTTHDTCKCPPSQPSPRCCSPSLMGGSANAATDTAHCESLKHPHSHVQVKPNTVSHCQENNKFDHPLGRRARSCLASPCSRKLSSSYSFFRANQGFFHRGRWASNVLLTVLAALGLHSDSVAHHLGRSSLLRFLSRLSTTTAPVPHC